MKLIARRGASLECQCAGRSRSRDTYCSIIDRYPPRREGGKEGIGMNEINMFWDRFLENTGRNKNTAYLEAFHFHLTEYWANELLRLVLDGTKRATSSSLRYFGINGLKIPQAGDLSIVTDWNGTPGCVIETLAVTILPFKDMTYDICSREGEDECLDTWRSGHISFFRSEGKESGYDFDEEMPVVFEDFKVVYRE